MFAAFYFEGHRYKYKNIFVLGGKMKKRSILIIVLVLAIVLAVTLSSCKDKKELNGEAVIQGIEGGSLEGLDASLDVSPDTTNVDFSSIISASEGATFKVHKDEAGETEVSTDAAVELEDGENIFYVTITSENGEASETYKLNVYKKFNVTVTYKNGDAIVETEEVVTRTVLGAGPEAPIRKGYTFGGWGSEGHVVTEAVTFDAIWTVNQYTLTLSKNINAAGTANILGESKNDYGKSVTVKATTNEGYNFDGWYDKQVKVSEELEYTFDMPAYNRELKATWKANHYTLSLSMDNTYPNAGDVVGGGEKEYGKQVQATARTNLGYTFLGWFDELGNKVSDEPNYEFTMPAKARSLQARWNINKYKVTITKVNGEGGNASGAGDYNYGTSITLTATKNTGYNFEGWFDENNKKVSDGSDLTYSFTIATSNRTFKAKWSIQQYTITFNSNGGSDVQPVTQDYGTEVNAPSNPIKIGHTFDYWCSDEGLTNQYTFGGTMPAQNFTLWAKWKVLKYQLNVSSDPAGACTPTGTGSYDYGSSVSAEAVSPNPGYWFVGWFDEVGVVDGGLKYTFNMPDKTVNLTAKWSPNNYKLTLNNDNPDAGTITGAGTYPYKRSVTIEATNKPGYTFEGWYEGSERKTWPAKKTFAMPNYAMTLTAKWKLYQRINYDGTSNPTTGNYILFGEWPQTLKADNVTIPAGASPETSGPYKGYYAGYDASDNIVGYYAEVTASPYNSSYRFTDENGPAIVSGTKYYFKVEPLKWRILESTAGKAMIICTSIIESMGYDNINNTYNVDNTHSELRRWLNNAFLTKAFSTLRQQLIENTEVNNAASTTHNASNPYESNNSIDKVFALSYLELSNSNYFTGNTARQIVTSDYTRAKGIRMQITSSGYGIAQWWSRSPRSEANNIVTVVDFDGSYTDKSATITTGSVGVVPVVWIKL